MTSRLDRLLLLLDTGSSTSVRTTAAKQLAQLAAKSVNADVGGEEDIKKNRSHVSLHDSSEWTELMAVVARILPYFHSKNYETRTAASVALSQICALVPLWEPAPSYEMIKPDPSAPTLPAPDFPHFSVQELMEKGSLLLASSGQEFTRPAGILRSTAEVQVARKEAMSRLGLDFLESVGGDDSMDWEQELIFEDADADVKVDHSVKVEANGHSLSIQHDEFSDVKYEQSPPPPPNSATPSAPSPSTSTAPSGDDLTGLSARERNRLKRKRKPGNTAFVAPPPQSTGSKYNATTVGSSNKTRLVASNGQPAPSRVDSPPNNASADRVIIDPSKGGAVEAKTTSVQQSKALEVQPGRWVWDGVVKVLEVDLFSATWEVRHGAAMALREVLKVQGKYGGMKAGASSAENEVAHEVWCNGLAAKFLCVSVLDRFGDFVSDQVVAPVREMVSQTLASLLLHMPRRSVLHIHTILLAMIKQDFPIPPRKNLGKSSTKGPKREDKGHVWEVRHAGLLGIKYEVAVRSDLVDNGTLEATELLRGVIDAAILGLSDQDDDVRSVAATCLSPVVAYLVGLLPEELARVLAVLWTCLGDMKDDLSSSVGAVMDLLGKLVAYELVTTTLADADTSRPLSILAPTLFPFFRHTIPNVRLAVVNTLHSFLSVSFLPTDWVTGPFLRLLFQNLVVEERSDIRDATLTAWRTALLTLRSKEGWMQSIVSAQLALDWYGIVMTPLGVAIDPSTFYHPSLDQGSNGIAAERHNVDKNMLAQDMALVSPEIVLKARLAAATALSYLLAFWPVSGQPMEEIFRPILGHYIDSSSMLQKFLAAVITEEWAHEYDASATAGMSVTAISPLATDMGDKMLQWLQGDLPSAYHEMAFTLARIHAECISLLESFVYDCRIAPACIPALGNEIDITGTRPGCFTIDTARAAVGKLFTELKDGLGRAKKREIAAIQERRLKVVASIEHYSDIKAQHDTRVSVAFAAAYVALKLTPEKVSPIVKGIMNGIKNEENVDLQTRSAVAVASFVEFCADKHLPQPPDKIVKNLCTFLCQDIEQTPTFGYSRKITHGILSFESPAISPSTSNGKSASKEKEDPSKADDNAKARLSRRGARLAFSQMSVKLGSRLLEVVPNMWQSMAGGLLSTYVTDSPDSADDLMDKQFGQDVIDSLSVLQAVVPTLHEDLWPKVIELFPKMVLALRSRFAIVRQCAARCFATICNVVTLDGMKHVIEHVVPLLGDAVVLANRQGATELLYHLVQTLDIKALPYVIFLVVPVLGRMSDPDHDVRSTSTNIFASLVKMVPLEAGLPDPPGFSEDLQVRRDTEREFLTQLLDGSKVERYHLPVSIKAELRKYQEDGVNWLAFLAKYQLHGILCDDMGLGKTLQSICILASKHFERATRYDETRSPDSVHLPSLIVCPPTLTGHWYYEILKYADNLQPLLYNGSSRDRMRLLPKVKNYDVIITSYEVVRNDIASLEGFNWHYCILDEGHIIKNSKTKLTKAVKCIRAQHRLILSGTPIQNNVLELWSLFDFLMPGFLGTESSFNERFGKPILSNRDGKVKNGEAAALALEALHKQVLPFLLRRLKEDVLHDLPPKIIQDYYCELSDLQKYLYDDFSKSTARHAAEDVIQTKSPGKASGDQQHVFQSLQYLRKLCNHPALVLKNDREAAEVAMAKVQQKNEQTNLHDIRHAPKLLALRQLLTDCGIGTVPAATGDAIKDDVLDTEDSPTGAFSHHRVLIFCQLKQMLDIIETDLFKHFMPSVTYMRLDGGTDPNKRHAIVQTFNADPSIDCLLLTTHVGGLGLTLTGADTVIFVEHDWNPMKDLQAMDRAHRIGQKKVVNVYRLITKGTLEEKIMGLQRFKLNIANSVVTQQNSGLASMDTELVLDLFKRTTEEEDASSARKKKDKDGSAVGQKSVLDGLEDLPPEEEYEGLDLSSFMGSLRR